MKFRSATERKLVQEAVSLGYEVLGRNGNNHLTLRHPNGMQMEIPGVYGGRLQKNVQRMLVRNSQRVVARDRG